MDNQQRWKCSKEIKSDMLEVNFESNVNRIIEETAGRGKADTGAV